MTWMKARGDSPDRDSQRRMELETRKAEQGHEIALADLDDERADARQTRRERRADRREARRLANLSREVKVSGARIAAAHNLTNTGEYRALRIQKIRRVSLMVLLPVLIAFGSWSTIGVQAGAAKLLGVSGGSLWTGAYFIEPALATIVAGIIIVRAALRAFGGDLDWRATAIEWGALTASLILNLAGAWPEGGGTESIAATVVHSIGPVGLMTTAFLIAIIDDAVAKAKPYEGHPSMADPAILIDSRESTHRVDRVDSRESTHRKVDESVILTHRLDAESPGDEPGESTHEKVNESTQKKPAKVIQASTEPVADRRQLVFNTYDAAIDAGRTLTHAELAAQTGVPKPTVGRYLRQRAESDESAQ